MAKRSRWLDGFALATSLPGSIVMIVCLFLPHTSDCHGRVHTAASSGWAPWMIGAALLGLVPLLWRVRAIRGKAPVVTTFVAVVALGQIVIGIPLAIYLAWNYSRRRPEDNEALTATSCTACVLVFLLLFPVLSTLIDRHWLVGGYLTWAAAWAELLGLSLWLVAARARAREPGAGLGACTP